MEETERKLHALEEIFRAMGSVAIGYSSGVDSTLMLAVAHRVLGDRAVAFTAVSGTFPRRERSEAADFCREHGITQVEVLTDELAVPGFAENPENRCYLCKKALFSRFLEEAAQRNLAWVCEGSNLDDLGDYRPGLQAVAELGIRSPLREAELTKGEIRQLSHNLGLPTWDKPSFACLASRIPYGDTITREKLELVDRAEQLLLNLGFRQMRVRLHGTVARLEVLPEDMQAMLDQREQIVPALKAMGLKYVAMDLQGFRTGSMNETRKTED